MIPILDLSKKNFSAYLKVMMNRFAGAPTPNEKGKYSFIYDLNVDVSVKGTRSKYTVMQTND